MACMLREDGLQYVKEPVVFHEGVWRWRDFRGSSYGKLALGRGGGEEREDVTVDRLVIWEDILG